MKRLPDHDQILVVKRLPRTGDAEKYELLNSNGSSKKVTISGCCISLGKHYEELAARIVEALEDEASS